MALIGVFAFAINVLVMSNNFVVLFFSWELVGLFSYLLISFWKERQDSLKSSLKAVLVNKIGDLFLWFAITFILVLLKYLNFQPIITFIPFLFLTFSKIDIISIIIYCWIIAGVTKSAQFPFSGWLTDAMAAPTPVSGLLHAATMVTAGIFLLLRLCSYDLSSIGQYFLGWIGSITTLFGGIVALFQSDTKKIIASSTTSQLG